ncbi:MAG: SH3 domain-containing protein [Candidatus Zixiibacteriota bacterium]|jgi:hypothetical protein
MSRVKYILAGLICTILAAGTAFADSGDFHFYNGPLGLADGENASVAMEAETVAAELGPETTEVRASFTFANRGKATEVTMFFPLATGYTMVDLSAWNLDDHDGINAYLVEHWGVRLDQPVCESAFPLPLEWEPSLPGKSAGTYTLTQNGSFAVTCGGAPVPAEIVYRTQMGEVDRMGGVSITDDTFTRWKVAFAAGETKTVECTYRASYDVAKHGMGGKSFVYPLYTGKTWAGPIGEGTITVSYEADAPGGPASFRSPGMPPAEVSADENETHVVWRFKAFEPGEYTSIYVDVAECMNEDYRAVVFERLGLNADKAGEPGRVLTDNLSFRTAPSTDATRVEARPKLAKGAPVAVLESRGEWWRVRVPGGAGEWGEWKDDLEGWIRWRYVDPDTGKENVYAEFAYDGGA